MSLPRTFLVEAYAPALTEFGFLREHARRTAAQYESGRSVQHVRTILVVEDETCFHLFQAESIEVLRTALAVSGLRAQRVLEVTT